MPRHQTIPIESRQNIRIEIAELRGVTIAEVPYPTSNITFYQYSLELNYITREYYDLISEIEMIRQRTRVQERNRHHTYINLNRRNLSYNQMMRIVYEGSAYMLLELNEMDNYETTRFTRRQVLNIIGRGMDHMYNQLNDHVHIHTQEHPMAGVENLNVIFPNDPQLQVTHERIMERHGERLANTNNSLCRECLFPIELGEELCEDCHMEIEIIPTWLMS